MYWMLVHLTYHFNQSDRPNSLVVPIPLITNACSISGYFCCIISKIWLIMYPTQWLETIHNTYLYDASVTCINSVPNINIYLPHYQYVLYTSSTSMDIEVNDVLWNVWEVSYHAVSLPFYLHIHLSQRKTVLYMAVVTSSGNVYYNVTPLITSCYFQLKPGIA